MRRIHAGMNGKTFQRGDDPAAWDGVRCRAVTIHGTIVTGRLEYSAYRETALSGDPMLESLSFPDVIQPVVIRVDHGASRLCAEYRGLEQVGDE